MLFGSGDNLVLQVRADIDEVVAVACDTDDEISIQLGLFMRIPESLGVNDIELYMMTVEFEIRPDKVHNLVDACVFV